MNRRLWLAVLASFGVYLTPILTPHSIFLLGPGIIDELTRAHSRSFRWIAADVALVIGAQAALLVLIALALYRRWAVILAVVMIPILLTTLPYAYLVAIPERFLIEPDAAPERQTWQEHCVAADAGLLMINQPVSVSARPAALRWVQHSNGRYALLQLPDCRTLEVDLPQPSLKPGGGIDFSLNPTFQVSSGATIFERLDTSTSRRTWWLLAGPRATLTQVPAPDTLQTAPLLTDDGASIAWLENRGAPGEMLTRVRIRRLTTDAEEEVDLASLGTATYVLLEVDAARREVSIWRNDRPAIVGFDGHPIRELDVPDGLRPQPSTYLRDKDRWVVWDAYHEDGRYAAAWSTVTGVRRHIVPLGRSITNAALAPGSRYVAFSTTTTLSIGQIRDSVSWCRQIQAQRCSAGTSPPTHGAPLDL